MDDPVECYSGVEYAQRPVRFSWRGRRRAVLRICAERRMPEGKQFDVVDEEGGKFLLTYEVARDRWTVRTAPREKTAHNG